MKGIQWLGALIAAIGVCFIIFNGRKIALGSDYFIGNILILFSQVMFAIYLVFSQDKKYKGVSPHEMILIAAISGALICSPFAVHETITTNWINAVSYKAIYATLGLGVVSGIFFGAFQVLIKRIGPSVAVVNLYLIPFFGIIWAGVLVGERVTLSTLVGGIIALTGVKIVTSQKEGK